MTASATFEEHLQQALCRLSCPSLQLKPEQKSSIQYVYDGKDIFVWLPTRFGKSMCYQVLPYLGSQVDSPSAVLVISPLVSLMVDQVRSLCLRGSRAAMMSSESRVPDKELIATDNDLAKASYLFSAPEAILGSRWRDAMENSVLKNRVIAVAIDEAHCVSKW